jgi:hypothetical protein
LGEAMLYSCRCLLLLARTQGRFLVPLLDLAVARLASVPASGASAAISLHAEPVPFLLPFFLSFVYCPFSFPLFLFLSLSLSLSIYLSIYIYPSLSLFFLLQPPNAA